MFYKKLFPIFLLCQHLSILNTETFESLIKKSDHFHSITSFPTQDNRIANIAKNNIYKQNEIAIQANNVRPIIHKKVMSLIKNFLKYKKRYGTAIEKKLYSKITEESFIDRLLIKRPLMFMTAADSYLLRNKHQGQDGFEAIGTDKEKYPLLLSEYLSYDEMQIAALLGVSTPTYFINNGSRYNGAISGKPDTYQENGICVGLVGARFEKPGLMEWQHMIVTPEQNTKKNNKAKLWSNFYDENFYTFEEAKANKSARFISLSPVMYLDSVIYKKRMRMVVNHFLSMPMTEGRNKIKKCTVVSLDSVLAFGKYLPYKQN